MQPQSQNTQHNSSPSQKKRNLLSIGDASEYLGVSIDTLRRWEKKGRIAPLRSPGGHRYFSEQDLDNLFGKKYTRDSKPKPRIEKTEKAEVEKLEVSPKPVKSQMPPPPIQTQDTSPATDEIQIPVIRPITLQTPLTAKQEATPSMDNTQTAPDVKPVPVNIFHQQEPPPPPAPLPQPIQQQTAPVLSRQQQEKLEDIIQTDKKPKKITIRSKWIVTALIMFAIFDLIFAYIWFSSTSIISPIP